MRITAASPSAEVRRYQNTTSGGAILLAVRYCSIIELAPLLDEDFRSSGQHADGTYRLMRYSFLLVLYSDPRCTRNSCQVIVRCQSADQLNEISNEPITLRNAGCNTS